MVRALIIVVALLRAQIPFIWRVVLSRKLSILFIIDFFHGTGGTEKHLSSLVCALSRKMFNVAVVVFDLGANPLIDDMRQAGASVIPLSVAHIYTPKAMIQAWRLFRLIRKNR